MMSIKNHEIRHLLSIGIFVFISLSACLSSAQASKKWEAPATAKELKNPFKGDANAVLEGKKIFMSMCVACHGETGKGNGSASVAIMPRPANFLSIQIESESDGAIFWKLTEGRPPMASYKTLLTDDQRWQLVTFIRSLEEKNMKSHEKKH
jgi:mono/diheme cytochrome c family protein